MDIEETPEVEEVEAEAVETPEFTLPEDFAQQVQSWDIPVEDLATAVAQYKSLQTDEGVIDAFLATGQALGFGLKELNTLFDDDPVAAVAAVEQAAAAVEERDPDEWITRGEADKLLADVRNEVQSSVKAREEAEFTAKQTATFKAIDQWFADNEIDSEITKRDIAMLGEKHILPTQDSYDPEVVRRALEQGLAEYEAHLEAEVQKQLSKKAALAKKQPTPLSGGNVAGGDAEEKVDYAGAAVGSAGAGALKLAKETVRARLRASGELG